jgi:aminotransferase EvaB
VLVPVADPRRALDEQRGEIDAAVARVFDGGRYILGPEHEAFERELASYLGVAHCVGVASGTDALELALLAVGCNPGDEVVVAANAGFYASAAARTAGLVLRYADVDETTLTLSASSVDATITPVTRAVVVTHLYGVMAEITPILGLCRDRGIALVEDCAQAAGARENGRAAGTFGDAATFSFYPTKNLAAVGDGGAVVTADDGIAERVRRLRQYGWEPKYTVSLARGRNSRLDELQAAILRVRLSRLEAWNERRREIASRYAGALPSSVGRVVRVPGEAYVAHLSVALVEDRERVRARLHEHDVDTDVHYPIADHRQPVWDGAYADVLLPVTQHAVEHVVTLPCFPELTDNEVDHVREALSEL